MPNLRSAAKIGLAPASKNRYTKDLDIGYTIYF